MHCPACGPLVKHSSPIGTGPSWTVQVGDGGVTGVTVDVEVVTSMIGSGSMVIGVHIASSQADEVAALRF